MASATCYKYAYVLLSIVGCSKDICIYTHHTGKDGCPVHNVLTLKKEESLGSQSTTGFINSLVVAMRPGRVTNVATRRFSNVATRRFSNSENVNYRIRISRRYNEAAFQPEKCQ